MEKYTLTARRLGLTALATPLTTLSNLVLLPILTKKLPIAEYGAWALVMVTLGLLPWLATLGLPGAMIRFLAAETDKRKIREDFYSMGLIASLISLIIAVFFLLFRQQIAASLFQNNLTVTFLVIPNIVIACVIAYAIQYFVTFQQIKRYSSLTVFNAWLNTALIAFFVLLGYGLEGAVTGLLIQQLVTLSVVLYLIVPQIGLAIPKFQHTKEHLAFSIPLVPGMLSQWITDSSDRYLIAFFLGTAAVGYYSPGYTLGYMLGIIAVPFATLLPPVLSKHYDSGNIAEVRTILTYSLKYYSGIIIPCVFALSVLSRPLLLVLTTEQIAANGYLVTPLVAAGQGILGAMAILYLILTLTKRTAIIGTIWIFGAALNLGLNLILIPFLGLIGAALTTFLAFLLVSVLFTYYSLTALTFDVNGGFIVKSVCSSSIMALLLLFSGPSGFMNILISIALAAVIYLAILLALRGITIKELKLIYRIYRGSY
jgi:O-antigen/teichoic acid export membrane protein